MRAPRKILVIKLRALGDTVLMTAPLNELRRTYPEAEIHVVVTSAWAPLLEALPSVNKVWPYERHKDTPSRAKAIARLGLKLRAERYDLVCNFHASPSSSILAFATGAKVRSIHFHGHKDKNRYSTVTVPGKGMVKPNIERDMDVVRALGIHVPAGRLPQVSLHEHEVKAAQGRLHQQLQLGEPILGIGLGSSRPTKSWPLERFAATAMGWIQKTGGSVLVFVGPQEDALAKKFLTEMDDLLESISSAQERAAIRSKVACEVGLPLRKLAAELSVCSLFLGNDSGPKHIAVATQTPTVTLFGPEDPFEWHPYSKSQHPYFFIEQLPCRKDADPGMPPWCALDECIEEQHRCMKQIGVDQVLEKCIEMVSRKSP